MFELRKATRTIGAEVTGVDLRRPLPEDLIQEIRRALLDNGVLFFRDQHIIDEQHIAFAERFGTLNMPPMNTDGSPVAVLDQTEPQGEGADQWHSDSTYQRTPPMGSVLRAVILPQVGGDTLWANMYAVYDSLAPWLQRLADDLEAEHDIISSASKAMGKGHALDLHALLEKHPPRRHPVVRVHPETGRKALFVSRSSATHLVGLSARENEKILPLLQDAVRDPGFQVRLTWRPGTIAFWDNRSTQHYAVADYTQRRKMHRVTINAPTDIDDGIPRGLPGLLYAGSAILLVWHQCSRCWPRRGAGRFLICCAAGSCRSASWWSGWGWLSRRCPSI